MIAAILKDNMIQNTIIINPAEKESWEEKLGAEIVDAVEYGLAPGDMKTEKGWMRNVNGEFKFLEKQTIQEFNGYVIAQEKVAELEKEIEITSIKTYAEINDILTGEVEKDELLA